MTDLSLDFAHCAPHSLLLASSAVSLYPGAQLVHWRQALGLGFSTAKSLIPLSTYYAVLPNGTLQPLSNRPSVGINPNTGAIDWAYRLSVRDFTDLKVQHPALH